MDLVTVGLDLQAACLVNWKVKSTGLVMTNCNWPSVDGWPELCTVANYSVLIDD